MKHLIALVLALAVALPAVAADQAEAAERARIKAERDAVDARFKEQERACRAKFAVTDCIHDAQRARSAAIADLRRQERVLNDADRRRRAAERQKDLDERNSPEARQRAEEHRRQAMQEQKDREARAAEKARKHAEDDAERARRGPRAPKAARGAPAPQGAARAPHEPKQPSITPEQAAKNRAAYDARIKESEEHNAKLRERVAKRRKPAASDLPPPQ
jgi:hypothetical protein